jgi:hypothetical protein
MTEKTLLHFTLSLPPLLFPFFPPLFYFLELIRTLSVISVIDSKNYLILLSESSTTDPYDRPMTDLSDGRLSVMGYDRILSVTGGTLFLSVGHFRSVICLSRIRLIDSLPSQFPGI